MQTYVLSTEIVAESLRVLRNLGLHRNTIMYLCAKRAATTQKTTDNVKVDFREFFDRFLTVRNALPDKPYIIPFESSDVKLWLNNNLAGSFAPSSIRSDNPVNTVLQVNGNGAKTTYSLRPKHWIHAANNLFNGVRILVAELTSFMYRDFAFRTNQMPGPEQLINHFQEEFGYDKQEEEFNVLFDYDLSVTNQDSFVEYFEI